MDLVLIIFWIIFGLCMVYAHVKSDNTYKQHHRILEAIFNHNIAAINNREFNLIIDYNHIEPYDTTFLRLWDWGYKRIVPPDVLEKIEPYIKSAK